MAVLARQLNRTSRLHSTTCPVRKDEQLLNYSMHLLGLFLVLFTGLALSCVIVGIEYYVRSKKLSKTEITNELKCALNTRLVLDHRKQQASRQQNAAAAKHLSTSD